MTVERNTSDAVLFGPIDEVVGETIFGDTVSTARLRFTESHSGMDGLVHGGVLAAVCESFGSFAAGKMLGQRVVTRSMSLKYVRPTPIDCGLELIAGLFERTRYGAVISFDLRCGSTLLARGKVDVVATSPEQRDRLDAVGAAARRADGLSQT